MNGKSIELEDIKSFLMMVGLDSDETDRCMLWTSPKLSEPLDRGDYVLAELTSEEQAFLRCMGYAFEEMEMDPIRLAALHETFWNAVRSIHGLPASDMLVKEGKYIVAMQ